MRDSVLNVIVLHADVGILVNHLIHPSQMVVVAGLNWGGVHPNNPVTTILYSVASTGLTH